MSVMQDFGREATPEEERALLAFMASFEPVVAAPQLGLPPRSPYQCPCGRSVAKPRALCIRCGNRNSSSAIGDSVGSTWSATHITAAHIQGHAQIPGIPEISAR